jgi:hypothetical protein
MAAAESRACDARRRQNAAGGEEHVARLSLQLCRCLKSYLNVIGLSRAIQRQVPDMRSLAEIEDAISRSTAQSIDFATGAIRALHLPNWFPTPSQPDPKELPSHEALKAQKTLILRKRSVERQVHLDGYAGGSPRSASKGTDHAAGRGKRPCGI